MDTTRAGILAWWNALSEQTKVDAASAIGYAGDIDDITITQVVHIYNSDIVVDDIPVENAEVFHEAVPAEAPTHGYWYTDKNGNRAWTEDFEESIGE